MDNNTPIIDLAEALHRAMGDADFLKMMLDELHRTIPDFMARITQSIQSGDMDNLGKDAHQFKGTAANLGAKSIAAVALELEQIGKSGDPSDSAAAFERLEAAVAAFNEHLNQIDWANMAAG